MLAKLVLLSSLLSGAFAIQATTTRYYDGTLGACGCGTKLDPYVYTAAGSQALFGSGTWCGSGCGTCYSLESTSTSPQGQGTGGGAGVSIVVAVTNLCPYGGNENWCPNTGSTNAYGFSAHFDINSHSGNGQFASLGWDNPIVNYHQIPCPSSVTSALSGCQCPSPNSGGGSAPTTTPTTPKVPTSAAPTTTTGFKTVLTRPTSSTIPPPEPTTTSIPAAPTTKTAATCNRSRKAAQYDQCGGTGWTGPTVCKAPSKCKYWSSWYSQCV